MDVLVINLTTKDFQCLLHGIERILLACEYPIFDQSMEIFWDLLMIYYVEETSIGIQFLYGHPVPCYGSCLITAEDSSRS